MQHTLKRQTKNIWHTQKTMYRFFKNPHLTIEDILAPLYERVKKDFLKEKEIIAIIDFSSIEKPYSRKMEKIGKVLRKDKEGTVNGYNMLSVILIGKNKTGIGYFDILAQGENWQNVEIKKAMKHTTSLLPNEANITWLWDRGFDSKKNYEQINLGGTKICWSFLSQ